MDIFASLNESNDNEERIFHISHVTPGFFIDDCINKYLNQPINKYTLPTKSTDKVELEQIPGEFLPPLHPYRPKLFYLPDEKIHVQRIVGYREIYSKKLRIEYLKLIEKPEATFEKRNINKLRNFDWIAEVAPGGGSIYDSKSPTPTEEEEEEEAERDKVGEDFDADFEFDADDPDYLEALENAKKLSPKGSDERPVPVALSAKEQAQRKREEMDKEIKRKAEEIQRAKFDKELDYFRANEDKMQQVEKEISRRTSVVVAEDPVQNRILKRKVKIIEEPETEPEIEYQPIKYSPPQSLTPVKRAKFDKELDYFRANEDKIQQVEKETRRTSVIVAEDPVQKKIPKRKPKIKIIILKPETEPDKSPSPQSLTPKTSLELREAKLLKKEKDDEWLELSESGDEPVIESLTKPHMPWMAKKLAHESQLLKYHLNLFYKCCQCGGRSFYFLRPNIQTRQIEYVVKKKKQIPFLITTAMIWIPLCLIIQSFLDITFSERDSGTYRDAEYVLTEKYRVMLMTVMANMILVGIWSCLVVLQDSLVITHYLNCWNLALNEMETSAISNIHAITVFNLVYFVIYSILIGVCFYFDWPETIRGTSGLISNLIFRTVISDMYLSKNLVYYEIFGAVFYLYVIYSCRCLHMLMQIVATIIRNSSEMWNLKFGLTFSQFLIKNRGELQHIHLGHSLVKLFTHHRLICGLVNIYGEAFAWPIVIFITAQMAVFLTIIVGFVHSATVNHMHLDDSNAFILVHSTDHLKTNKSISISQSHEFKFTTHLPRLDAVTTMAFVAVCTIFDFLLTTEIIAKAGQSFVDGFEFVRRQSVILCTTSHQRRLIQSLEWSMSAASPNVLSVRQYFSLHRSVIFSAITSTFAYFSLIIQIKTKGGAEASPYFYLITQFCKPEDDEANRQGYCLRKVYRS